MTPIEKLIGKRFKKQGLLTSALTHPSYPDIKEAGGLYFQRMEFLGDSIVNSFIAFEIYKKFPKANEGVLTRFRSLLVSRKILAQIASKLKLNKYLKIGGLEKKQFDWTHEKIMADAFEALVAAIYLDSSRKKVDAFLSKCFRSYIKQKTLYAFSAHPKSILQEYSQKKHGVLPQYKTTLNTRKKIFETSVQIGTRKKAKGNGRTKQEAESSAATELIKKLKTN